jgi:hypothetical protein
MLVVAPELQEMQTLPFSQQAALAALLAAAAAAAGVPETACCANKPELLVT